MRALTRQWYEGGLLSDLLRPLGALYGTTMRLRRGLYRRGWRRPDPLPVPVVVVGNLTVGGTGKTPLAIALVEHLLAQGRRPAVVSRGYGRREATVRVVSDGQGRRLPVDRCGDEPALMADRLPVPVVVGADRSEAVRAAARLGGDCVVADDGFQRLSLPRHRSFVVVDAHCGLGNGRCLPAGPLREPISALADADAVVLHGEGGGAGLRGDLRMTLSPEGLRGVREPGARESLEWLRGRRIHAMAGIGDPERFFATLRTLGAEVVPHPFPDHHGYRPGEVAMGAGETLVTTEKDAVKLAELGIGGWALRVSARLEPEPGPWLADLPW
ncbi:tetraacyldisaccharide 4'-kinase [Thiohalorhabdus denitrificans]|uniref:Tetraacyldisaccharide 4'-kinase n=1 Tax=Thiohalorhabdus denitrificans TaxID=381306 RepID=A0A1G5H2K4_9GAMM|nr:tetraacyldisaccharide 4'-kinase [Thiohalorhabdus denitrificans]SCY57779.1 lipid-A-disaccharide kinase [Thiohalorhabdus denitrificans]